MSGTAALVHRKRPPNLKLIIAGKLSFNFTKNKNAQYLKNKPLKIRQAAMET